MYSNSVWETSRGSKWQKRVSSASPQEEPQNNCHLQMWKFSDVMGCLRSWAQQCQEITGVLCAESFSGTEIISYKSNYEYVSSILELEANLGTDYPSDSQSLMCLIELPEDAGMCRMVFSQKSIQGLSFWSELPDHFKSKVQRGWGWVGGIQTQLILSDILLMKLMLRKVKWGGGG